MPDFEIQCDYSGKKEMKFFNDKEPKEYHVFLVNGTENIPDEYFYFAEKKNKLPCFILILDDLVKKSRINFGNPYGGINEYKFIINLGEGKVAKFNIDNSNKMVLKTKEYFKNTVQKIGFWGNKDYFYEVDKKEKPKPNQPSSNQTSNQNIWVKVVLICLPFLILALLLLLIKWVSKKEVKINRK